MVRVRFFAILRDRVGREVVEMPVSGEITLRELEGMVVEMFPQMEEYLRGRKVLISVNQEFATPETVIKDGDEVAFLPPFSGG